MLSHPLLSTPKTDLDLPRFPCRIQLSTQQPTTYQGFSVAHSVAYSYLHNSPRPVKVSLSLTLSLTATYTTAHDLSVKQVQTGLIQVSSPKQLASPSNTGHIPVVRPSDATAVQQSVILAHGPNYRPPHSDLSNAVSYLGHLQHLGTPFRTPLCPYIDKSHSLLTSGFQEFLLWVWLLHVVGHVRHSIL